MLSEPPVLIVIAFAELTLVTAQSGYGVSAYEPGLGVVTAVITLVIISASAEKRGRPLRSTAVDVEEAPVKRIDAEVGSDETKRRIR